MMRRVVVTGLGLLSPHACGVEPSWASILAGNSAARRVETFDVSDLPAKIACTIPRGNGPGLFNPDDWMDSKDQRKVDEFIIFAMCAAKQALDAHYADELGEPFRTAGLCLYRDGRDSVAWHGDTIGRGATQDTMVAIVSVGAPRVLLLRPRGGGQTLRYELGHGDLIVMGGSCQRSWEHAVPKTVRPAGPRISIQFRPQGVR